MEMQVSHYRTSNLDRCQGNLSLLEFFHIECLEHLLVLSSPDILPHIYPEFQSNLDREQLLDGGAKLVVEEWISAHRTTGDVETPLPEEHFTTKQAVDVRPWFIGAVTAEKGEGVQEEGLSTASLATNTADVESRPSEEAESIPKRNEMRAKQTDKSATMIPKGSNSSEQVQSGEDDTQSSGHALSPLTVAPQVSAPSPNPSHMISSTSESAAGVSRESKTSGSDENTDLRTKVPDNVRYSLSRALNAWTERKVRSHFLLF